ncbi:hypothetical protein CLV33_104255 [Jejuia pallidilutea]|jgi:hypothetical protein|uniref:T9SS C-terminal target domain-containing protein n=1 Tax=Jejuia pallidilutea TaxID=504487 RepID=A0A362X3F3_9FLAO|nr:hypothetical protein [Jejuia pallidilutea]PQV49047.1 hypothetical protein CLV33_104255 [Jejuia pallidilutea]
MKKITQLILGFLLASGCCFAQQEKGIVGDTNWLNNWTEFKPNEIDYGEPTQILTGNISEDTTLKKGEVYLLLGSVFVTNDATLTIEPGTVILGDYNSKGSLTISRGAKIMAQGYQTDPIIFSSNKSVKRAGDWGGLVILGDAPINRFGSGSIASYYPNLNPADYTYTNYGGENTSGFSGVLQYVRIEYAGKRISQDTYFNGLFLACVGESTKIDHVMISHSGEDGFEVWGGNISLNNLVSYRSRGTDYKFNYGSTSQIFNSLALRSPYASNGSGVRCLEVRSYNKKEESDFSKNKTLIEASNLTFLTDSDDLKSAIEMNLVHEAIYVGENTELNMLKSVVSGFNPAVILDQQIQVNQKSLENIAFTEMYFNNCNGNIFVENNSNNEDLENWYGNRAFFNVYSKSNNTETFISANNYKRPDFRLRINKIIASNIDSDLIED